MSPRLRVRLRPGALTPGVLAAVKRGTGLGLSAIRMRAEAGEPVIDIEMFTNHWYDGGVRDLLRTVGEWDTAGIGWEATEDDAPVTLDYLRNIIAASDDGRTRPCPSR